MSELVETNELVKVVETSGLEKETAVNLKEKFLPFYEQIQDWKKKAETLVVTDANQVREMQMARTARLALKEIRINADKTRKALKEDSLRYGKAVQGIYNLIEFHIAPIEKHLQEQEDFAKIQEQNRKESLASEREERLRAYDCQTGGFNLGEIDENSFMSLLNGAKKTFEDAVEAKRKEEEERIENERIKKLHNERKNTILHLWNFFPEEWKEENLGDISEKKWEELVINAKDAKLGHDDAQKQIAEENERLKKEKDDADKILAEERRKAEADKKILEEKAQRERKENERKIKQLQAEAAEKVRKELAERAKIEAANKAAEKERKKAAAAPDKTKLLALASAFETVPMPTLSTDEGKAILKQIQELQTKLVNFINQKAETL